MKTLKNKKKFAVLKRQWNDKITHALFILNKTLEYILDMVLGEMMSSGKMPMSLRSVQVSVHNM
jgi:hypothetical protein